MVLECSIFPGIYFQHAKVNRTLHAVKGFLTTKSPEKIKQFNSCAGLGFCQCGRGGGRQRGCAADIVRAKPVECQRFPVRRREKVYFLARCE